MYNPGTFQWFTRNKYVGIAAETPYADGDDDEESSCPASTQSSKKLVS